MYRTRTSNFKIIKECIGKYIHKKEKKIIKQIKIPTRTKTKLKQNITQKLFQEEISIM